MECIICFEPSDLLAYKHDSICFGILVHDSCLMQWYFMNNFECILCRRSIFPEEIFTYNQLYVSNVDNQVYVPQQVMNGVDKKVYCIIISIILFVIVVGIFIIIIFTEDV